MLAQASATIPYPSRTVVAVLADPTRHWAIALDGDGGHLLAKVGVRIGKIPIYKHVQLRVDAPATAVPDEWTMLPVSWEAVGGPPIFPRMEGTVHVQAAGPGAATLTLNARYDPPLGKLGRLLDRVALHRVAAITMGDFVGRLAAVIVGEIGGPAPDGD